MQDFQERASKLKGTAEKVLQPPLLHILDNSTESKEVGSYDYKKHGVSVLNLMEPYLLISDPAIAAEMMTTKNNVINKPTNFENAIKNFFGKSFLFSPTDD
mmetsp:Transcript_592/g.771  ORF Transcript_592/g.771 Transcript_592/m.771 type:complete len:101 (-) Transcript_592:1324-1626(-)